MMQRSNHLKRMVQNFRPTCLELLAMAGSDALGHLRNEHFFPPNKELDLPHLFHLSRGDAFRSMDAVSSAN